MDSKILRSKYFAVFSIMLIFEILKEWSLLNQLSLMTELSGLINILLMLLEIPMCWSASPEYLQRSAAYKDCWHQSQLYL